MNDISRNFRWNAYDASVAKKILELEGTSEAIKYFSKVCNKLTNYAYWFFLSTLWVSYSGFSDIELWKKLFSSSRGRKRSSIMKPSEVKAYDRLPYFVRAYRAHRPDETDWIAYTLSKDIALRFAKERGVTAFSEYEIKKKDITALFLRREEQEIILLDQEKARFIRKHIIVKDEISLSPWLPGDKGYICLPLKRNVPDPKHQDWKLVHCSICGMECWESTAARYLKNSQGMRAACTECSLKAGVKNG